MVRYTNAYKFSFLSLRKLFGNNADLAREKGCRKI